LIDLVALDNTLEKASVSGAFMPMRANPLPKKQAETLTPIGPSEEPGVKINNTYVVFELAKAGRVEVTDAKYLKHP